MKLMLYHYSEDPTIDDRTNILETMRKFLPHPEVPEALRRLKPVGYRLVTRTNSPPAAINAQLAFAGIANMFEVSLSVDAASNFKPHRAAYDTAARRLDAEPADLMLVPAHNLGHVGRDRRRLASGVCGSARHGARAAGRDAAVGINQVPGCGDIGCS